MSSSCSPASWRRVCTTPWSASAGAPASNRGAGDASFHSEWDLRTLADAKLVALAPRAVTRDLPDGLATVVVADPPDQLQTALIWRTDDSSPANRAFRATALETFASAPGAPAS